MRYLILILFFSLGFSGFQKNQDYKALKRDPVYVKVKLFVYDGLQEVSSLIFNEEEISLKPKDPQKSRGEFFFRLRPGKYMIQWTTKKTRFIWPRKLVHKKTLNITKKDHWIYIRIDGASINIERELI